MNEFELIERYFRRPPQADWCRLGVGDDAAVIRPPEGEELVICSDTLVAGRHFPEDTAPADIGWKSLAVNLSDLAAMGARPLGCLLNLCLPQAEDSFLEGFASGFFSLAAQHGVELIGGDTTRGPLCISVTAFGAAKSSQLMRRDAARPGDIIAVEGRLGGAALALRQGAEASASLRDCLNRPRPLVEAGLLLAGTAHAAIDISDGLAADLNHILVASGVGARLDLAQLPLHPEIVAQDPLLARNLALEGGDDYALCVTLDPEDWDELDRLPGLSLRRIGEITEAPGLVAIDESGAEAPLKPAGFRHF